MKVHAHFEFLYIKEENKLYVKVRVYLDLRKLLCTKPNV